MTGIGELDLNLLRVFVAIVRNGNITKAAEELSVTQSSVSQSLAKLRTHFDDPLFIKVASGVKPTQVALDLMGPANEILNIARLAFGQASAFDPARLERTISICVSGVGELTLVPRLVARLKIEAPGCLLKTVSFGDVDINSAMKNGEVDITITGAIKAGDDVFQQRLFTAQFVPVVNIHSTIPEEVGFEDFRKLDLIVPQPNRNQPPILFGYLQQLGIMPHAIYASGNYAVLPLTVSQYSDGACIVPKDLADLYSRLGVARELKTRFELPEMEICQYWHRINAHSKYMRWLRGLVYRTFNESPII